MCEGILLNVFSFVMAGAYSHSFWGIFTMVAVNTFLSVN